MSRGKALSDEIAAAAPTLAEPLPLTAKGCIFFEAIGDVRAPKLCGHFELQPTVSQRGRRNGPAHSP